MTDMLPGADWYPDPEVPTRQRWWTGAEWTHDVRETPTPAPPVPTAPVYAPMSGVVTTARQPMWEPVPTGSPNTAAIWVVALYPLAFYPLSLGVQLLPVVSSAIGSIALSAGFLVLVVVAIVLDTSALAQRGFTPPSRLWILLSPVGYLIARRVTLKRQDVKHNAPGNAFVLALLFGGLVFGLLYRPLMTQQQNAASIAYVESELASALTQQAGVTWQADCPDDTDVSVVGTVMECMAHDAAGATVFMTATVVQPYTFEFAVME